MSVKIIVSCPVCLTRQELTVQVAPYSSLKYCICGNPDCKEVLTQSVMDQCGKLLINNPNHITAMCAS